jgi:jumonji domain-containing protein 7
VCIVVRSAHLPSSYVSAKIYIYISGISDPYENIYTVIRGTKHFTLFPPTEGFSLCGALPLATLHNQSTVRIPLERIYKHARYTRPSPSSPLILTPSSSGNVVRWSSIADPTLPGSTPHASPLRVTIQAGETLYLPPAWWHHVRQSADDTGICIALNWWYDMEMRGMHWVWLNFLRGQPLKLESEEVKTHDD